MEDSNNDLLSDLVNEVRGSMKTNNQLLRLLVLNQQNSTQIAKQPAIAILSEEATEGDIWAKVNEIIGALSDSGLTE